MTRAMPACVPSTGVLLLAFIILMVIVCPEARAVPSFTRQTGLTCHVCHSNPPELTAFGRKFKLDGYTLTDKAPNVTIENKELKIRRDFPVSVMLLLSDTFTKTPVPGAQSSNAGFPQALSLFLAGEISPHMGGMVQATYSHQSDHLTLDNTDIRYADHTTLGSKDLLYGLTLNNSPTVEDVWNSTPAWGYPWLSSDNAPSPGAGPVILGALAQDVAGLGAYTMWNDHLYAAVTLYRSEHAGGAQPLTGTDYAFNIQGAATYWRLAWQQTWGLNYLEAGTYGIYLSSVPGGATGIRDTYADSALDLQYERPFGVDLLTFHTTYVHERSDLNGTFAAGGAATPSHNLNTFRADATYHLRRRYSFTLGGFSTTGSADSILFAPAPVTGSSLGKPDSSGLIVQAGFWPVENVELSAEYTGYATFNGARRNYDGAGRSASANNSLFVALWLNF
ncbi:MAG: cytochrome C [Thermoanaerobaculia bacterium]